MKTLTLMRHAKSDWGSPRLPDHDRSLNERGMRDAPMMAQRLLKRWAASERATPLLISSTALRAKTTAGFVARALDLPLRLEPGLYPFALHDVKAVITAVEDDVEHLMLVGHNPGISILASALGAEAALELPTAAVVSLQFDANSWADVLTKTALSSWFDKPKFA